MAAENFKVKRGLEVGTGSTITSGGVNVTGIITAVQFKGDGSGLTGVVGSGSGVIIKDEGSTVGTAGTINFVGSDVSTAINEGTATVTINSDTTTINNNANNRLITGSGTANTLEAESGLTYDGTYFNHIGSGFKQLKIDTSTSNSASLLLKNQQGNFTLNTINNAGNRNFTVYDGTAGLTRFSINHDGTVGITSGLNVTGVVTATTLKGNGDFVDIDVDGQTEVDDLNVSGIGTIGSGGSGYAELQYQGVKKLETTSDGVDVFNIIRCLGGTAPRIQFFGDVNGVDTNTRGTFGLATGANQIVHGTGANDVALNTPHRFFIGHASTEVMAKFDPDGPVQLYHDNIKRLETTGIGATVFGQLDTTTLKVGTGATVNSSGINVTGIITATSFSGLLVGNVQGNATSASSCSGNSVTATTATNVTVTANNSTDETVYPVFVDGATGTQGAETDTGLSYNPSTGQLNATKFVGDGSGLTDLPGGGSYGNNDVDTHLNTSTASNGEVLSWNGSDYDWVAQSGGSGISTANVVTDTLNVAGVSTFNDHINVTGRVTCSAITISDGQPGLVFEDTTANPDFILQNRNGTFAIRDITSSPGVNRFFVNAANGDVTVTGNIVGDNLTNISGIASVTATSFHGSGALLTSLNADNIGSGEIPNGRFPATLPAVSGANLTNLPAGNLTGTLPAISGENLTGIAGFSPDAQGNLVAGTNAGANFSGTDAEHNILIGYEAGNAITTADNNVAIGYEALKSVDTESGNTAVGYRALKEVTGMGYNVAVGYEAGYYTYSMYECVAVGFKAMSKPTQSGVNTWYSVAIGANAMAACGGDRCVAVGHDALDGNNASGADDNTAIGNESLFSVGTNALKNTAVGSLSGKATTSGEENVYIGYNAGNNAHTTGNNCIIIGNNAAATSSGISSEITLGDTNINKFRIPGISVTFTSTTADSFSSDGQFVSARWTLGANGSSHYTFTGPGGLSNADDPTIYLARGQTYEFLNNSGGSHPFQIRVSNGGSAYSTGVTNNGASSGTIKFEVPFSAPNTLYYQCTAHSSMGGNIVVYPST